MDILVELEYPALSDRMMQSDTSELEAEHGGPLQNCTNVSRTLALGEDEAPPLDEGAAVACRPDAASARGGGVRVATVVLARSAGRTHTTRISRGEPRVWRWFGSSVHECRTRGRLG